MNRGYLSAVGGFRPRRFVFLALMIVAGFSVTSRSQTFEEKQPTLVSSKVQGIEVGSSFDSWKRHRETINAGAGDNSDRDHVVELSFLFRLIDDFDRLALVADPYYQDRRQLLVWRQQSARLKTHIATKSRPSPDAVDREITAHPDLRHEPQRWRLQDIFLRMPPEADERLRQKIWQAAEDLRRSLLDGVEDFGDVALRESESQTRLRRGKMGVVSLDRLSPTVAAVVKPLKQGELSPVFEVSGGLFLLRCTEVYPARDVPLEEIRRKVEKRLQQAAFEESWGRLESKILGYADPWRQVRRVPVSAPDELVVATARSAAGDRGPITAGSLRAMLGGPDKIAVADDDGLDSMIRRWVALVGKSELAQKLGICDDESFQDTVYWITRELEAAMALSAVVAEAIEPPTDHEVRTAFGAMASPPRLAERIRFEMATLPIRSELPRDLYCKANELGDAATRGELSFSEVVALLNPHVDVSDSGWVTMGQVFGLGLNAESTLHRLEEGSTSSWVQEGRRFLLFHMLGREPERSLTFEEARVGIEARLMSAKRKKTEESVRARIIREVSTEVER